MKKFYKKVSTEKTKAGFSLLLDGKNVKTPAGKTLNVNTKALVNAVADEWRDQGEKIDIKTMPLTTMCYAAIDQGTAKRKLIEAEVGAYAGTDLICYRAEIPKELQEKEAQNWDPIITWLEKEFGLKLAVTNGIAHVEQQAHTYEFVEKYLVAQNIFPLIAMQMITGLLGSVFLCIAVVEKKLNLDEAWQASHIDEDFQMSMWGDDSEAKEMREEKYKQFSSAVRFLFLANDIGK